MRKIIMILSNEFDPDVRVYKEAKYLIKKGFEVTILCWYRDNSHGYPLQETIDGIDIIRFDIPSVAGSGYKQIIPYLTFIKRCKQYIKKNACDYIHCNDLDGAICGFLINKKKYPMVFDMHEFYENGGKLKRFIIRKMVIFLLNRSKAGIRVNDAYLIKEYSKVKTPLYLLKNYPDWEMVQRLPKTESNVFRIGYHGAVRHQLDHFSALFDAVKNMKNVRVDINGNGPDLEALLNLEKKYQNVHIHGVFDGTKVLSHLYEETDVLFCGYNKDNPNYQGDAETVKFFEAIHTCTPVIITDGIGMSKTVREKGFGIVCDTTDEIAVKEAINKFIQNPDFLHYCSKNEYQNIDNYSWEVAVKVLDEIYV